MADEIKTKRAFHEDIFAEGPDKWSWPVRGSSSKATTIEGNYTSEVKSDSSCSSGSENGFVFRDSDSQKKSLSKRGSSSDLNNQEDISSSSHPSVSLPRERLMPSIYDDDAQSGSPSGVFEKKDFAFLSSFKKSLGSKESSPTQSIETSHRSVERSEIVDPNSGLSPGGVADFSEQPPKSFFDALSKSNPSRNKSGEIKARRRSRTRSRSRDRRIRSPRREKRSRSRDRRSDRERGRYGRGGPRSRSKESRRRSRSHSRKRRRGHYRSSSRDRYRRRRYSRSRSRSRERTKSGSGSRKPGSLSLSSGGAMTPQMALQQTMAEMSAKAQAMTGIALPKYYNPAAVNPLKYAEQVQKRKLLWQTKPEKVEEQPQAKNSVWDKMTFAQDQDGKMTAKFRKLMGIKSEEGGLTEAEEKEAVLKKQEEIFRNLDQQYEMARMTTHTQRGVGLGYSGQTLYTPVQK